MADDHTDPTFVLGAVLAQLEDLAPTDAREVLLGALTQYRTLDDIPAVVYHYREARSILSRLHTSASEEGGMTGPLRDALFGIASALDAVMALAGVDQFHIEFGPSTDPADRKPT